MTNRDKFQVFQERIQSMSVLVIGDVMLDRYLYGTVNRVSPEAPVPVLDYTRTEEKLGGAGNVALNFKQIGVHVDLVSVVGTDPEGKTLLKIMAENGIATQLTHVDDGFTTSLKTRVMAGQQHLLRVDRETIKPLNKEQIHILKEKIKNAFGKRQYDIVILQDYNKGVLGRESIGEFLYILQEHDTFIAVDPKVDNFWLYKGVDMVKPNLLELSAILGKNVPVEESALKTAARQVEKKLHNKISVFTLAEHGIFIHDDKEVILHPTQVIDIIDVCGAGDAVIAVITLARQAGMPVEFIAELSNAAGRIVCNHIGVVPINIEQLKEEIC